MQTAGNQQQEVQVAINSASVVGKSQQGGGTRGVACRRGVPPSSPEIYIPVERR